MKKIYGKSIIVVAGAEPEWWLIPTIGLYVGRDIDDEVPVFLDIDVVWLKWMLRVTIYFSDKRYHTKDKV